MANSRSGETVLERAVRVFEAFDASHQTLSVSELADRADLPISTASRMVEELICLGLLRRDGQRHIRMGVRMWELASRASPALSLRETAMPFMEDLHTAVGQHTQLGVLENGEVLFLERLSAQGSVVNITKIAGRLPLHLSSSGLVLLAHARRPLQEQVLNRPLQGATATSVTDSTTLRSLLSDIRQQGFVVCPGFIVDEATGVAAPIRDPKDRVVAALSIIVPTGPTAAAHVPAVVATARAIQRSLRSPAAPRANAEM